MFAGPADVEQERKAFSCAVDSCNRLLSVSSKHVAILPVHWKSNAVIHRSGRPQEAITDKLLSQADALVAAFRGRIGTSTGVAESGTVEEVEEARSRKIPCLVCFYDRTPRTFDLDQLKEVKDYQKRLEKQLLTFPYTSTFELQSHLTEWLFELFFQEDRIASDSNQDELKQLLKISDHLLEPIAKPVANVLYEMAGTKEKALLTLRIKQNLTEYAHRHGWQVKVKRDKEIEDMGEDYVWNDSSHAKESKILLSKPNEISETDVKGHVIFDYNEDTVYLNDPLRLRLEDVLEQIGSGE